MRLITQPKWGGTLSELTSLDAAIAHNCACFRQPGRGMEQCGAHRMLADQQTLDHLLAVRRMSAWYVQHEFAVRD